MTGWRLEGLSGFSCTRQLGQLKGCSYVYSLKQKHKTKMWWMSPSSFHCSRFWQNGHLGPEGWLPGVALHGLGSGCLFLASFLLHLRKKVTYFGISVNQSHIVVYKQKIFPYIPAASIEFNPQNNELWILLYINAVLFVVKKKQQQKKQ